MSKKVLEGLAIVLRELRRTGEAGAGTALLVALLLLVLGMVVMGVLLVAGGAVASLVHLAHF